MANKNKGKTRIPVTSEVFQIIRNVLLSENNNISLKDVFEVNRFLSILDFDKYSGSIEDVPIKDYLTLLLDISENCINNNMASKVIFIQTLLNESKYKEKFKIMYENREEISNEDLNYIKRFMTEHVSAAYIFDGSENLKELITMIGSGDYNSVEEAVEKYKNFIFDSYKELNNLRIKESDEKLDSSLNIDSLTNLAAETIKEVSTPGYLLNTGLKNLDNAMGGGLKRGTLTLFGAKTAGFKSGIMLNLACSIKMFSKDIETFDKTKKPCIIYLSLENTQTETFKRVVTYTTGMSINQMKKMEPKELAEKALESLNCSTANKDVDMRFLYKTSNTIDVNYIYNVLSDLESEGYEVVALFVDYLATLNSRRFKVSDSQSSFMALGDNARELYDLAITKKIAVVSGFQLNRKAYEKNDLKGKESLAHTGESLKLTTHADNIFIMNKSKLPIHEGTDKETIINYIRFDEAKQRSTNSSKNEYFYEVFDMNNSFRLIHSKFYKNKKGESFNFELLDKYIKEYDELNKEENKSKNQYNNGKFSFGNNIYGNVKQPNTNTFNSLIDFEKVTL